MENKKLKTLSIAALIVSVLPLATLVPVFLKLALPEGVNTVWAGANVACVVVGLILEFLLDFRGNTFLGIATTISPCYHQSLLINPGPDQTPPL